MLAVEALLFDLDGTLIDSKRDLADSVQHLQKQYDHRISSEETIAGFVGDGVGKLVQRALPNLKEHALVEAVHRFKCYYHRHCLDHTRPYAGVREIVERWRGKKLAVVTNKPTRISRHILEGLGLLSHFRLVLGGDFMAQKKPHPAPLWHAMKFLKVGPRQTVMIGDSPNDILAGRAAGVWTCGLLSNIGRPEKLRQSRPDFLIRKPFELLTLFR